jgi:hypothetical protein
MPGLERKSGCSSIIIIDIILILILILIDNSSAVPGESEEVDELGGHARVGEEERLLIINIILTIILILIRINNNIAVPGESEEVDELGGHARVGEEERLLLHVLDQHQLACTHGPIISHIYII